MEVSDQLQAPAAIPGKNPGTFRIVDWVGLRVSLDFCMVESTLHTRQSSTQNNKYQVSHKHSCISWRWAHSRPKHVEFDKYKHTKKIVHEVGFIYKPILERHFS
jgi:hypothetical protein